MSETIELPTMPTLRWRMSRNDIARCVLRLTLTRAYDGRPLTRRDRELVRRARNLLRRTKTESDASPRRVSPAELEINRLYDDLALLDSKNSTPARADDRARKLSRLRDLQRAEADRADLWLKAHAEFDPDAAREAMRRAVELIARHARPS